jgi:hypothetical protein
MHGLFRVYSLAPWFKWIYTEKSVYIYFESESLLPFSNSDTDYKNLTNMLWVEYYGLRCITVT